ncbi:Regulator of G-protein signaling 4 [Branchiostoma belcheri]|nr:Regulator of G-protein signaling 4 [Branchiostoma belcheri]
MKVPCALRSAEVLLDAITTVLTCSSPPHAPLTCSLAELCATFLGYQEGVRHVVKNLTIKKLSPWSQTYLNTHTFLYKPAQHLSQVAALLDTILRCTSTQHQDFLDLQTVIRALKQAIKSAQESTMRSSTAHDGPSMVPGANLHKIQKSITFAKGVKHFVVNVPKRTLVHSGELTLVEKKKTTKVWTMLFNDILVFTNLKEEGKICVIREPIPMEFVLVNTAENELEFHVTHLSKVASSNQDCQPGMCQEVSDWLTVNIDEHLEIKESRSPRQPNSSSSIQQEGAGPVATENRAVLLVTAAEGDRQGESTGNVSAPF